jgi:hypothetical protein
MTAPVADLPFRWYCRNCMGEGTADSPGARDSDALKHVDIDCKLFPKPKRIGWEPMGKLLHVWRYE